MIEFINLMRIVLTCLFFFLGLMVFAAGCRLPWAKRSPYTREELRVLRDRDLYIIDGRRYLKVRDERGEVQFVEAREYLHHPGRWTPVGNEGEGKQERLPSGSWEVVKEPSRPKKALRRFPPAPPFLKRKVAILPFEEGTSEGRYGELAAQILYKLLASRGLVTLPVDYAAVVSLAGTACPTPDVLKTIGESLGVQAVIGGVLYGPFTSVQGEGFVELRLKIYDVLSGEAVKDLPLQASVRGDEEEILQEALAKGIGRVEEIIREMGWCTRVAKVEGGRVYLLAGEQSGLRKGDVLEVYGPSGERRKGAVEIVELFGGDKSVARGIDGGKFQVADLVFYTEEGRFTSGQALKP